MKSAFAEVVNSRDQTAGQVLRDVMRDYLARNRPNSAYELWFRRQVQAGLDSANAGRLIPHEDVEAEFMARRERTLGSIRDRKTRN